MLLASNTDGVKYAPRLDMKPSRDKGLSGDQVYPSPAGDWLLGLWANL